MNKGMVLNLLPVPATQKNKETIHHVHCLYLNTALDFVNLLQVLYEVLYMQLATGKHSKLVKHEKVNPARAA